MSYFRYLPVACMGSACVTAAGADQSRCQQINKLDSERKNGRGCERERDHVTRGGGEKGREREGDRRLGGRKREKEIGSCERDR